MKMAIKCMLVFVVTLGITGCVVVVGQVHGTLTSSVSDNDTSVGKAKDV